MTHINHVFSFLSCFSKFFLDDNQPFTYNLVKLAKLGRYRCAYEAMKADWRLKSLSTILKPRPVA